MNAAQPEPGADVAGHVGVLRRMLDGRREQLASLHPDEAATARLIRSQIDALTVALAAVEAGRFRPTYRHKKRGTEYELVGLAQVQTESALTDEAEVVVYRGADGVLWVRSDAEFNDGRFEPISPTTPEPRP